MTGGQTALFAVESGDSSDGERAQAMAATRLAPDRPRLKVVVATASELAAHERRLDEIDRACRGNSVWRCLT